MKLVVTNPFKRELSISAVKGVALVDKLLRVSFATENESQSAFRQLCLFGIRCYHAGRNAPDGPMVILPQASQNGLDFRIQ